MLCRVQQKISPVTLEYSADSSVYKVIEGGHKPAPVQCMPLHQARNVIGHVKMVRAEILDVQEVAGDTPCVRLQVQCYPMTCTTTLLCHGTNSELKCILGLLKHMLDLKTPVLHVRTIPTLDPLDLCMRKASLCSTHTFHRYCNYRSSCAGV